MAGCGAWKTWAPSGPLRMVLVSQDGREGVIEWTHWKTKTNTFLRGDEWYIFNDDQSRIKEIRAYYASPVDNSMSANALHEFDYAARGYAMKAPIVEGRS